MAGLMGRGLGQTRPEVAAVALGVVALVVAHAAQLAGNVPCALCYLERWPYRVAVLLGVLAWALPGVRFWVRPLLVVALAAGAAIAFVHVGVEFGWWKSPLPECAAPILNPHSVHDLLASMPARPSKPCDDPTDLIPGLPVSMAQMNLMYALFGTGLIAMSMRGGKPA